MEMPNAGMMGGFINVFNMFGRKLYHFGVRGKHSHPELKITNNF